MQAKMISAPRVARTRVSPITAAAKPVQGVNPTPPPAPSNSNILDNMGGSLGVGVAVAVGAGAILKGAFGGKKAEPVAAASSGAVVRASAVAEPKTSTVVVSASEEPEFESDGLAHGPLYYTTLGNVKYHTKEYMKGRINTVEKHFPGALGIDDFMNRAEIALYANGFSGDNSIAMSNLCRDEVCIALKDKIDTTFGWTFNTSGIGGILTCGVSGMKAGLSHSPVDGGKKERYVFFSFPHIAIDSQGRVGAIERPGRPGESCACGALVKLLGYFNAAGIEEALKPDMAYDVNDPEVAILRTRLARKMKAKGTNPKTIDLVGLTKVTEQVLSSDLEDLIAKAVDANNANYAVITGVQIHNWTTESDAAGTPNLEFVQPVSAYAVIDGVRRELNLSNIPPMTPRQTRLLAKEDQIRRGWQ